MSKANLAQSLENLRVLLVEDCLDQGRLYLHYLQSEGAEVTLECNGKSAVDAVKKSPDQFHAVLMDFQMPEMDGIAATLQLRQLGFQGAILAMTAYATEELKESWQQAGCNAFLEKPIKKKELINELLKTNATKQNAIA